LVWNKLAFRISLTVALSVLVVGGLIAYLAAYGQKEKILTSQVESLDAAVSSLRGDIVRAIQKDRYPELQQTLHEICQRYNGLAFTLFDDKGQVAVQEMFADYKPPEGDFKLKLRAAAHGHKLLIEVMDSPSGKVLRYFAPIHDDAQKVIGGLDMELPYSSNNAEVMAFDLKAAGLVLLGILLITGVVVVALQLFVMNSIHEMQEELVVLSKGKADLTYRITIRSKDEIGEMARWFNAFLERIRITMARVMEHSKHLNEQVQSMTHSTAEVSAMSEDVTTTVQQIAKGAEEQAAKITEVSHLMQEMQDTMKEVERKAQETTGAVEKATQTAKTSGKLAHGTIEKMVELNGAIVRNTEMVNHLGEKSQQVSRVVEIISNIAEQTNLLSLNAAIEAARAGEQGKGFAVVAEEIRNLADGASKATQDIGALIQEIQDQTQAVVVSMEKNAREAQLSKDGIRQLEGTLDQIITVIENVVGHSKSISDMINAQSQRYTKIVNSIQEINAVSEQSAASTEEVSASTEEQAASMEQVNATCKELLAMAEELNGMVEKFKVK